MWRFRTEKIAQTPGILFSVNRIIQSLIQSKRKSQTKIFAVALQLGQQTGDGEGLFVVRFVAPFFCRGKVAGGFVLITYLLVRDVLVVMQEQVRLAIRPSKHDTLS